MFLSPSELRRQRSPRRRRRRHINQGKAPPRTALRLAPPLIRYPSVQGSVWLGLDGILSPAVAHNMGAAFMLYAQGLLPFLLPLSVYLFEPTANSRQRMAPFLVLGAATTLYILWTLTAFPTQIYVKENTIVYINQATNNEAVAVLYIIATCGSLFFSKIRMMVLVGAANLVILLAVMEVKRYAFTSLWCAYAAIATVIILAYFWRSHGERPFLYA